MVRDGNIITGGGVTAGIDFALAVLAEIGGVEVAQTIQLGLEYAPAPPFDAGRAESAPANSLAAYREQTAEIRPRREAEAHEAASRLGFRG